MGCSYFGLYEMLLVGVFISTCKRRANHNTFPERIALEETTDRRAYLWQFGWVARHLLAHLSIRIGKTKSFFCWKLYKTIRSNSGGWRSDQRQQAKNLPERHKTKCSICQYPLVFCIDRCESPSSFQPNQQQQPPPCRNLNPSLRMMWIKKTFVV